MTDSGNLLAPAVAGTTASSGLSAGGESTAELTPSTNVSETDQSMRRRQIRDIMNDSSMNQLEKSKLIQGLMDGRSRRSSMGSSVVHSVATASTSEEQQQQQQQHEYVTNMAQLARVAATSASFYSSDDEGDAIMNEATPDNIYDYNQHDNRSVASSISHTSNEEGPNLYSDTGGSKPSSNKRGIGHRQIHGRSFSLPDWNDGSRAVAAVDADTLFADKDNSNKEQVSRLMERCRPVCNHYERQCSIIAACCGLAFGCRICHDECPVLPPPIHVRQRRNAAGLLVADQVARSQQLAKQQHQERRRSMPLENDFYDDNDEDNHHLIDRFAIREVICRKCYTRQSSKTNNCVNCGVTFGNYHCNICNLWMSDAEMPYHCAECGFCRVGGRENFRHCRDCGMCIDTQQFDDHNCKAGKYNSKCPVCQEDLFSSRQASHEMPCGHAIHWHCFKELTTYDTRCPVCKRTAETREQMASTWSALAMGIALQPVPREMARLVNIICFDCSQRDYERRWHFLGVRCMNCLSFNTNVEQIILQGPEAADFLDAQDAARGEETNGVPPTISALALAASWGNGDDDDDEDDDEDDLMMMDEDDGNAPSGVDTSSGTHTTSDFRRRRT